jgi:phage terminase large subunit-like protein
VSDVTIDLKLHPKQLDVFRDPRRFKIVVAGRRFGKSRLAAATGVAEVMRTHLNGYDLRDKGVFIIAPTHDQAKRIYWPELIRLLQPVATRVDRNTGRIETINERWIEVRGADKPDSMRGVGLSAAIPDEYAGMKPNVWEEILRPALADVGGRALFIGTPAGKNHFYQLVLEAQQNPDEWGVWRFKSTDNPFLDPEEVKKAAANMTAEQFAQEFEASFAGSGAGLLRQDWLKMDLEPTGPGYYAMAVDLAGFVDAAEAGKYKRTDNSAIAIVKIHAGGWHVKDIRYGQWGVRECAVQMLKAAKDHNLRRFGIEKGMAMNAVMPYLTDRMRALNFFPEVVPLWHGGKKKTDRIMWALAGRLEKGRMTFQLGAPWVSDFIEEYSDFPNPLAKDDLLDALAYVDQLADDSFEDTAALEDEGSWQPVDAEAGY